ncbi:glycosyltransferase family 8 C-terminal domain-containing protein [Escherichia coli]
MYPSVKYYKIALDNSPWKDVFYTRCEINY